MLVVDEQNAPNIVQKRSIATGQKLEKFSWLKLFRKRKSSSLYLGFLLCRVHRYYIA